MAKIKIKFGENEVEIDSRDFYIDNNTIGEVIDNITKSMQENQARIIYEQPSPIESNLDSLDALDNAEVHEPEFSQPVRISETQIPLKLQHLVKQSFFDTPRTVSETVAELSDNGWSASPLDVSKALTKMTFNKEISKNSQDLRNYYFTSKTLIAN